jgi:hypothetical protein
MAVDVAPTRYTCNIIIAIILLKLIRDIGGGCLTSSTIDQ